MTPFGIMLVVTGLAVCGLGIAGRIKAARLAGPRAPGLRRKPANVIYEAQRLYTERARTVVTLTKSGNRLIITGVSLCLVGIVLIL